MSLVFGVEMLIQVVIQSILGFSNMLGQIQCSVLRSEQSGFSEIRPHPFQFTCLAQWYVQSKQFTHNRLCQKMNYATLDDILPHVSYPLPVTLIYYYTSLTTTTQQHLFTPCKLCSCPWAKCHYTYGYWECDCVKPDNLLNFTSRGKASYV